MPILTNRTSLENQLKTVRTTAVKLYKADPQLRAIVDRLRTVKGVGEISALRIIAAMPELGSLNRRQVAALAGVAPLNRDSGTFRGYRRVAGGRATLRSALYMVALVASRHNPPFSAFYRRLREAGKKGKVALVAVMRKMIVYLNAILKADGLAFA